MALRIRLQRAGATHAPVYRIVVAESTFRRDGRFVETLGIYNPKARGQEKEVSLKLERVDYWLGVGAKPSDTVRSLIKTARKGVATVGSGAATAASASEEPAPAEPAPRESQPAAEVAEAAPEAPVDESKA
jgi:small subunit ribosomal protein S16